MLVPAIKQNPLTSIIAQSLLSMLQNKLSAGRASEEADKQRDFSMTMASQKAGEQRLRDEAQAAEREKDRQSKADELSQRRDESRARALKAEMVPWDRQVKTAVEAGNPRRAIAQGADPDEVNDMVIARAKREREKREEQARLAATPKPVDPLKQVGQRLDNQGKLLRNKALEGKLGAAPKEAPDQVQLAFDEWSKALVNAPQYNDPTKSFDPFNAQRRGKLIQMLVSGSGGRRPLELAAQKAGISGKLEELSHPQLQEVYYMLKKSGLYQPGGAPK